MIHHDGPDNSDCHCFRGVHVADAYGAGTTVLDVLAQRAARRPDAPAMTEVGSTGSRRTLTYGQLHTLASRGATWLQQSMGLEEGATLGLIPHNNLRCVATIFGALSLGARVAFLDPNAPAARHQALVDALGVGAVARSAADPHGIEGRVIVELDELPTAGSPARMPNPAADAFYFGTSGSTATSKIVAQTHQAVASNALAVRRHHSLGEGDRFLSCLPIHHVNGLHFTVMATMFCGSHAILVDGFDPPVYRGLLAEFTPRVASVVPSLLQALVVTWREGRLPDGFGHFVSAAAPLSRALAVAVRERWGAQVLQGYGLTETTNFSTTLPWGLSDAAYARLMLEAEIPTIGVAVDGNEVAVLDADAQPVEPGAEGEICVRGHNVMDRYVGNDAETDQAFRQGWFHTGDLGRVHADDEEGSDFIVVTGRAKNVAKVRGESVSLDEMERVLLGLDGVRDAACAAVPDEMLGEAVIAAVVTDDQVTDMGLVNHLRETFPELSLPRRLLRLDAIPRTATGKVLRPQLRALLMSMLGLG